MSRAGARPTECGHAEVDLHGHKCPACGLRSHQDTTTGRFTSVREGSRVAVAEEMLRQAAEAVRMWNESWERVRQALADDGRDAAERIRTMSAGDGLLREMRSPFWRPARTDDT